MAENKELTHAEVWDDSTLLNSWDAALQEYKKYHSIQASGAAAGSVPASTKEEGEVEMKDVHPQQLVHSQESEDKPVVPTYEEEEEEGEVVPEVREEPRLQKVQQEQAEQVKDHTPEPQLMTQTSVEAGHKPPSPPPFPPSILAGENEALRNLMISWYFAGYYTGLYEGQQKQ